MTPDWETEVRRLLAKVAQLSFDAVERSAEIERLRAALGSAGYARALKECDELRAENGRLRAYARRIAAAPSAGRPGARPMTTDFQDAAADLEDRLEEALAEIERLRADNELLWGWQDRAKQTEAKIERLAARREKNERNARVQVRYDELMQEGKHGHYETMFRVVREEVERAIGVHQ